MHAKNTAQPNEPTTSVRSATASSPFPIPPLTCAAPPPNQTPSERERERGRERAKRPHPRSPPPPIHLPPAAMANALSEDQIASMREAFTLFDTDGDGRIAPTELGVLMRSLGGNPTQAQLRDIAAQEKLTAPFDFPRFLELMRAHLRPEPFDRPLRDAFRVLDKDASGTVSVADLRHVLTSIGEKLEPHEFDEWIREVDVAPDGTIRYDDFIRRIVAK
ncbi:hypothetical protein PR202_gb28969 [Eleusine coracana subsp. coracana]|uniref:EF-hand domain-containing protein n=1 Tax=Eleusine coracana subsp. coracana TaxID=191504 RepID=A0AAV5G055_ELECO|nr:hypothetical protein PR202_gb28969 [Eleusine coracana subsp. coracana]